MDIAVGDFGQLQKSNRSLPPDAPDISRNMGASDDGNWLR
jgi:hypothetical protein